jgi:hypothetical protein
VHQFFKFQLAHGIGSFRFILIYFAYFLIKLRANAGLRPHSI